ncbi:MAG: hypothetical protein U0457_15180 [Candidatus Sericytochromatia bacterium]
MKYYFENLEEPLGNWSSLLIKVKNNKKPNFRVECYDYGKIKLIINNKTIFWGTPENHSYEFLLLKEKEESFFKELPIKPINSYEIEKRKNLFDTFYFKEWSIFFAKSLCENKNNFLYDGLWLMVPYIPEKRTDWKYKALTYQRHDLINHLYDIDKALIREDFYDLDWFSQELYCVLGIKDTPKENSSRVKFWRKKIKENSLPPIFILYLSFLEEFIIIDGHSRLMASILENVKPKIIAIYPIKENNISIDNYIKLNSLKNIEINYNNSQIEVKKTNDLLINLFKENKKFKTLFTFFIQKNINNIWDNEVKNRFKEINLMNKFDLFVSRKGNYKS